MKVQRSGNGAEKLKALLAEIGKKKLSVGFFDSSKYPDGTPVAYVAAIQEFGYPAGNIPPRPFMRPTISEQRQAWVITLQRGYRAVINEKIDLGAMLNQVGALAAGQVKMTISKIITPPLSSSTIRARKSRKKGPKVSNKPLVDTGYLISQVQHSVENK